MTGDYLLVCFTGMPLHKRTNESNTANWVLMKSLTACAGFYVISPQVSKPNPESIDNVYGVMDGIYSNLTCSSYLLYSLSLLVMTQPVCKLILESNLLKPVPTLASKPKCCSISLTIRSG